MKRVMLADWTGWARELHSSIWHYLVAGTSACSRRFVEGRTALEERESLSLCAMCVLEYNRDHRGTDGGKPGPTPFG